MDFHDYEDKTLRKKSDIGIGVLLSRTYNVPLGLAEVSYPVRGDLLPGTSGLTGARLYHRQRQQPRKKGHHTVQAVWIQPAALEVDGSAVAAVGTYQEVRSSRNPEDSQGGKQAVCIGVASDTTNIPDRGDAYPGTSNELTMRCVNTVREQDTVPGLYFAVSLFRAPRTTGD